METNEIVQIYFDIQKPFYYPGEQILGSIFIEFFDSIKCNEITIISKGKQYIKINRKNISREIEEYEESFNDDEEEDEIPKIKNENKNFEDIDEIKTVFKYQKKLKISNNYISKGKYTFPFEVELPNNIPSSFLYINNNIYFEIIYTIKIKFDEINNNYKEAIPIIIRQKEKLFNYPKSNEYKKILGECCWERGQTSIKITPQEKYTLINNKIKLNVLINNEQSGMPGTPLNLEVYQKLIFFPKDKNKKIHKTKLVGKAKGINVINPRKNFNEDIEIKLKENKIINFYKERTKAFKYSKNKNIIELLTTSIKSDFVICEYDVYVESQFVGWFKEELGVFNKVLIYPPEKGILIPDMENIKKEFLNSLAIKKIFLSDDNKEDEIILGQSNKGNKNDNNNNTKNKKGNEKKDKKDKKKKKEKIVNNNKKGKNIEEYNNDDNDYDKENIDLNNINNINNDDINENFNINEYSKKNKIKKNKKEFNYFVEENNNLDKFKKKLGKDFFDEHALDDDFLGNTLDD
jgi:hypothetical protein